MEGGAGEEEGREGRGGRGPTRAADVEPGGFQSRRVLRARRRRGRTSPREHWVVVLSLRCRDCRGPRRARGRGGVWRSPAAGVGGFGPGSRGGLSGRRPRLALAVVTNARPLILQLRRGGGVDDFYQRILKRLPRRIHNHVLKHLEPRPNEINK